MRIINRCVAVSIVSVGLAAIQPNNNGHELVPGGLELRSKWISISWRVELRGKGRKGKKTEVKDSEIVIVGNEVKSRK
ncbi:hypothetical protein TNCV_494171 [Trichonephila clavipes]|nr:hypothetical protein TNCV_494171 [Trichonephila clavipes]